MNENHMDDTFQQQQEEDYSQLKQDLNQENATQIRGGTELGDVVVKSQDFKSTVQRQGDSNRRQEFMEHGITDDKEEMQVLEGLGPQKYVDVPEESKR